MNGAEEKVVKQNSEEAVGGWNLQTAAVIVRFHLSETFFICGRFPQFL